MAVYMCTLLGGNNDISNPENWSGNVTPSLADSAIIDSSQLGLPAGAALSLYGSLDVSSLQFIDSIELTNVSLAVSYELSVVGFTHFENGSITVNTGVNPGNFDIGGSNGSGEFIQDNGSVTVNAGLLVGYATNGSYGLNGGTMSAQYEVIAGVGSGSFTQTGGANTVGGGLTLGQDGGPSVGNSGAYTLAAGTLTAGLETVGDASAGEISQSGGGNTVAGTLTLGNQQASSGAYFLTGGTLSVLENEVIGFSGAGHFDQGGGDNAITGGLIIGVNQGSNGDYLLHGSANLHSAFLTVGVDGDGSFTAQDAGTSIGGPIKVGVQADAHGSIEVNGSAGLQTIGANSNDASGTALIGINGGAELDVLNGGSFQANYMAAGINSLGHGTIDVAGTGSILRVYNDLEFGHAGSALMRVEANAELTADRIIMATQSGSRAAIDITDAGTMVAAGPAIPGPVLVGGQGVIPSTPGVLVGGSGEAALSIENGAMLTALTISVGDGTGGQGQISAATGADIETSAFVLGNNGSGRASLSDPGTVLHTSGQLPDTWPAGVIVGFFGAGELDLANGAHLNTENGIVIGADGGSTGSVNVDGGALATNSLVVGSSGNGTLTYTSGTIDVNGDEYVGGLFGGNNGIGIGHVTQDGGATSIFASLWVGISEYGGVGSSSYVLENDATVNFRDDLLVYSGQVAGNGSLNTDVGDIALYGGVLEAQGGTLAVNSSVQANGGHFLIDSDSTLEFAGNVTGAIAIAGAPGSANSTLILDDGRAIYTVASNNQIAATHIVDDGWIEASSNNRLVLQGDLNGHGTLAIESQATVEFNGAFAGTAGIDFFGADATTPTTLQIDQNNGTVVNGFDVLNGNDVISGFMLGDVIDLAFLQNGHDATLFSNAHQNLLEVDGSNGTVFLQFDLLADYSHLKFELRDDLHGGTDVFLAVPPPNQPPVAASDFIGVEKNASISVDAQHGVLSNDTDPDGDALSVTAVNGVATNVGHSIDGIFGKLTLNANGSFEYVANSKPGALPAQEVPQELFSYTVSDGHGGTSTNTLDVTLYGPDQSYGQTSQNATSLAGGNGRDVLVGAVGNDVLNGGNGADWLIAGPGNDAMTGGNGPDVFVFNRSFGHDIITDFRPATDTIQVDHAVFSSFSAVEAAAHQVGSDVEISFGASSTITLDHVALTALHASDFHLA